MKSSPKWMVVALRAFAELCIIVVGVLIALSADTWMEARRERRVEAHYLAALRDDLIETSESLRASNEGRARLFVSIERLVEENLSEVPVDSVAAWVHSGLFLVAGFEPRLATIADLENTGQLRLLPPEVRSGVSALRQRLHELERIEGDVLTSQQTLLDAYLVERTPLAAILATSDELAWSIRLPRNPDWSPLKTEHALNAMAFKVSIARLAGTFRAQVADELDELLGLVDQRLLALGGGPG